METNFVPLWHWPRSSTCRRAGNESRPKCRRVLANKTCCSASCWINSKKVFGSKRIPCRIPWWFAATARNIQKYRATKIPCICDRILSRRISDPIKIDAPMTRPTEYYSPFRPTCHQSEQIYRLWPCLACAWTVPDNFLSSTRTAELARQRICTRDIPPCIGSVSTSCKKMAISNWHIWK